MLRAITAWNPALLSLLDCLGRQQSTWCRAACGSHAARLFISAGLSANCTIVQ